MNKPLAKLKVVTDNAKLLLAEGTPMNVLIEGNQIAQISAEPIDSSAEALHIGSDGVSYHYGPLDTGELRYS